MVGRHDLVVEPESEPSPPERVVGRRARLTYLILAVVLAVGAVVAIAVAAGTDADRLAAPVDPSNLRVGPPAPDVEATAWLNSPPLTARDLKGKVVLYDFWTYSCVNCVRTIPYLRAWNDRYASDGLVIVGVHSPEFEFEKSDANVATAARKLGVTWPIAIDDDHEVWDAFAVQYWPTKIVADRDSRVRFSHIGEGQYANTESVLRALLAVDPNSPRAVVSNDVTGRPEQTVADELTPERYLGTLRGSVAAAGARVYPTAPVLRTNELAIVGPWKGEAERIVSVDAGAAIVLAYRSREVNLVMSSEVPGGLPTDVYVEVDGKPVPPELRTPIVQVDARGRTFVRVLDADMYRLVRGPAIEEHTVTVTASTAGLAAYAFTFGV